MHTNSSVRKAITLALAAAMASLSGCAAMQHGITDAVGGVGGAAIGAAVDKKNPLVGGVIGAAGGVALGEVVNYLQDKAKKDKYTEGYNKGRSDEVKTLYWAQRDLQKGADDDSQLRRKYVEIPVEEHRTSDGTVIEQHTRVMEVVE